MSAAGAATGGTWCSVAANQITLDTGYYLVDIVVPAHDCNLVQSRLYNVTGTAALLYGLSIDTGSASPKTTVTTIKGGFQLLAQSVLQIQMYSSDDRATYGMGIAADTGQVEIYTMAHIIKIG